MIATLETTKTTFTKTEGTGSCNGTNHGDFAFKAFCDTCKASVYLVQRDGKTYKVVDDVYPTDTYFCFAQAHACNETSVEFYKFWDAYYEANGKIVKGTEVVVVRGRKTPIGTEGVVFWLGKDNYGNDKAGIKDAEGNTIWIALNNLVAKWSNEYQKGNN